MTQLNVHCLNPLVALADQAFDPDLSGQIIELGKQAGLSRAKVAIGDKGIEVKARTNSMAVLDQWAHPALTQLVTTVAGLVRLPPENCEPMKLLHYEGDEKFEDHLDAFDPGGFQTHHLFPAGQRLFTTLCYLNDVPAGGETVFPKLKLSVRPKLGRVLVFSNTVPGTIDQHLHSVHTGQPVAGGEKWVVALWWRQHAWHVPRDYPEETGPMRAL